MFVGPVNAPYEVSTAGLTTAGVVDAVCFKITLGVGLCSSCGSTICVSCGGLHFILLYLS